MIVDIRHLAAAIAREKRKASMLWYLERLKELDPSL